ncbi:MAG: 50S ribosomal protein L17, partial [Planctomycetota bacterium]
MRHRNAGRHLGRTSAHRKAMRRNMVASLFEHGAVRTTPAKAKEVRRFAERLITLARKGTLHARRRVIALLGDRNMADKENPRQLAGQTVVQKLFDEIGPRYADRPGGYTRLIRLPERRIGDSGEQVLLQLVEETSAAGGEAGPVAARRRKQAARRAEAARASAKAHAAEAPAEEAHAQEQPEQEAPEAEGETEDDEDAEA